MILVERFINELMSSNCYVVWNDVTRRAVVIDPASQRSERELKFIESEALSLEYIILTHEHTDHNWGANSIKEAHPGAQIVCSAECEKNLEKSNSAYFLFYYDNPDYVFKIKPVDIILQGDENEIVWGGGTIKIFATAGHSSGSVCINVCGNLFTGDTLMPFSPYFDKKNSDKVEWKKSIDYLCKKYPLTTVVYPGHGDPISIAEWLKLGYLF